MTTLTQEEANAKLTALVEAAYAAVREAEAFADEHKLGFSFDLSYGMGGYYNGDPEEGYGGETGWNASSMSC